MSTNRPNISLHGIILYILSFATGASFALLIISNHHLLAFGIAAGSVMIAANDIERQYSGPRSALRISLGWYIPSIFGYELILIITGKFAIALLLGAVAVLIVALNMILRHFDKVKSLKARLTRTEGELHETRTELGKAKDLLGIRDARSVDEVIRAQLDAYLGKIEGDFDTAADTLRRNLAFSEEQIENITRQNPDTKTLAEVGSRLRRLEERSIPHLRSYYTDLNLPSQPQRESTTLALLTVDYWLLSNWQADSRHLVRKAIHKSWMSMINKINELQKELDRLGKLRAEKMREICGY